MIWSVIAWIVTQPRIFNAIRERAMFTPYSHIKSADGTDLYMGRWWIFNPYAVEHGARSEGSETKDKRVWWRRILPSIRLHYIARPDRDHDLHDHPWNARTIIGEGWYREERYGRPYDRLEKRQDYYHGGGRSPIGDEMIKESALRATGYTGTLKHGEFHRITSVSPTGVWTIFITWRKQGSWGFDVDGVKVNWRDYLAKHSGNVAEGGQ